MRPAAPLDLPEPTAVLERAGGENFPVALRLLSARHRSQLTAIYGFARLVDQLGDDYAGDRLAALDWLQEELDRAYRGDARHPLMVRLQDALAAKPLPREPFARLIEANRADQRTRRYETFEQLLSYCHLSADPVGELVLCVFDLATPERIALSNHICTALQLAEHWQDAVEDLGRGRVYIPAEDLERFEVVPERLPAADPVTRERMRRLMAFEVARARALLDRGTPLVGRVAGRPKLAIAAFAGGGRAALDAIGRRGFDVLDGAPRAGRARRLVATARLMGSVAGERARKARGGWPAVSPAATDGAVGVEAAYRACEQITRRGAANFYYGIRLLPADKRRAMCAVYAFARRVDDIGDGPAKRERKLALLDQAEESVRDLSIHAGDPAIAALAHAHTRFPLPVDALYDLIEGVRMDVHGTAYESFDELLPYCRRVAGSIGRLCLAIFGARELERAWGLADDLGVAMQLTNILRDVREDAARGRVYLPREDLARYALSADGRFEGEEGQFEAFMRFQAARAGEWFERGMRLVRLLDRRSGACVLAMTGIYRGLLDRIEEQPELTMRERVSLPAWEKAWVATRSLIASGR